MNSIEMTEELNFTLHDSVYNNDWVSTVQVSDKWVLSGNFDSTITIHTILDGEKVLDLTEHEARVHKVLWVDSLNASRGFLSAANDTTVILWDWDPNSQKVYMKINFCGHEKGVQAVDVNPNFVNVVTGGADCMLNIWSMSSESENDEPASKKLKGFVVEKPLKVLEGHKETVTSASWLDTNNICSTSMDHTIKFWDVETCALTSQTVEQRAFLGASWSHLAKALITCSADTLIRLYDPRSTDNEAPTMKFTNSSWVSAVSWCKYNEYYFVSAGYDHLVKVWDARKSNAALHNLTGHDGKVLCVDWSNARYIASGATDNLLQFFRNK